jgi:catechol 2,3-dioxygenase-like lactoylglutathione lyase family enzyme
MTTIGPSFIALQVSDLETSARFYTEELGLDRVAQNPPGAVVFATTPIPFAVRVPSVSTAKAVSYVLNSHTVFRSRNLVF